MFEWVKDCLSFFGSQSISRQQQPSRPKGVDRSSPLLHGEDPSCIGETKWGRGSTAASERLRGGGTFSTVPRKSVAGSNGAEQGSSNRKQSPVSICRDIYIGALNEIICAQEEICVDLVKQLKQSEERLHFFSTLIPHFLEIQDYFTIRHLSLESKIRSTLYCLRVFL